MALLIAFALTYLQESYKTRWCPSHSEVYTRWYLFHHVFQSLGFGGRNTTKQTSGPLATPDNWRWNQPTVYTPKLAHAWPSRLRLYFFCTGFTAATMLSMWFYAVYLRVNGLRWQTWSQTCTKMILPVTWTDFKDFWLRLLSSKWKAILKSVPQILLVWLTRQYVVAQFMVLFWLVFRVLSYLRFIWVRPKLVSMLLSFTRHWLMRDTYLTPSHQPPVSKSTAKPKPPKRSARNVDNGLPGLGLENRPRSPKITR